MSSQGLTVDGIRQLHQNNAHLCQKLDEEISERGRQINNLKTEQVLAIAALKEIMTGPSYRWLESQTGDS